MRAAVTRPAETHVSGWGIRVLLWSYRYFGFRFCRAWIAVIVACAYPFLGKAKQGLLSYHAQWSLFTGKSAPGLFRHICTFAYTLADRLACRAGFFNTSRVRVISSAEYEELTSLYQQGQGVFCIVSHLGCFDMLRVMFDCTREDMKGEIHVFMDKAATQVFAEQQLRYGGARLETYVHAVQDLGLVLSMQMAEKLEQGAMLVMAGDRTWRSDSSANYMTSFLGLDAAFPRGCFRWAAALKVPVYTMSLLENNGHYDLHIRCLSAEGKEKARSLLERFVEHLENLSYRYPTNWFNFYHFWK